MEIGIDEIHFDISDDFDCINNYQLMRFCIQSGTASKNTNLHQYFSYLRSFHQDLLSIYSKLNYKFWNITNKILKKLGLLLSKIILTLIKSNFKPLHIFCNEIFPNYIPAFQIS